MSTRTRAYTTQIPGAKPGVVITTEHPASRYGLGVVLVDGKAYGPDDIDKDTGMPFGSTVHLLFSGQTKPMDADCVDALCRWFSQSPMRGDEWQRSTRELQADLIASLTDPVPEVY